jgi:dTMP kinase
LKRGLLITLEGVDGSGKTTQLRRLESFLAAKGFAVTVAQEPGGTRVGREIRRLLLDAANEDLRSVPELLLYFASRVQNIEEVIEPALREGRIVVADRFTDATVAYQGYGRELGIEAVRKVESVACQGVQPDLTLLLDIDIETGVGRALDRNADQTDDESRMEQESRAFYERVAQGYAALLAAEPERIKKIDGRGSIDEVTGAIEAEVESFLAKLSKEDPA